MDLEKEKRLLAKYPFHIYLMVKAAAKALEDGRAEIRDGVLVVAAQEGPRTARSRPEKP